MIMCYWTRGVRCTKTAVVSVGVKRAGRVIFHVDACDGHVPTARQDAMEVSRRKGGSMSVMPIVPVVRATKDDPLVNASIMLPRSEHRKMILTAQTLGMSQRAYTQRAINNQITLDQLMIERGKEGQGS